METFSVTQVLPVIDFHCTPEQLEQARQEGNENHSLVKMFHDTGETFNNPFLEMYKSFLDENKNLLGERLQYEERLYSKRHGFNGKPDTIFEHAIVDLKRTLGSKKRIGLQCAGYHILAVENHIIKKTKRWFGLVVKDGTYKITNVYDEQAEEIFIACLKDYKLRRAIENYFKI